MDSTLREEILWTRGLSHIDSHHSTASNPVIPPPDYDDFESVRPYPRVRQGNTTESFRIHRSPENKKRRKRLIYLCFAIVAGIFLVAGVGTPGMVSLADDGESNLQTGQNQQMDEFVSCFILRRNDTGQLNDTTSTAYSDFHKEFCDSISMAVESSSDLSCDILKFFGSTTVVVYKLIYPKERATSLRATIEEAILEALSVGQLGNININNQTNSTEITDGVAGQNDCVLMLAFTTTTPTSSTLTESDSTSSSITMTLTSMESESTTSMPNTISTSMESESTTSMPNTISTSMESESTTSMPNTISTSMKSESTASMPNKTSKPMESESTLSMSKTSSTSMESESTLSILNTTSTSMESESTLSILNTTSTSTESESTLSIPNTTSTSMESESTLSMLNTTSTSMESESATSMPNSTSTSMESESTLSMLNTTSTSMESESTTSMPNTISTSVESESTTSMPNTISTSMESESTTSMSNTMSTSMESESTTSMSYRTPTSVESESTTSMPNTNLTSMESKSIFSMSKTSSTSMESKVSSTPSTTSDTTQSTSIMTQSTSVTSTGMSVSPRTTLHPSSNVTFSTETPTPSPTTPIAMMTSNSSSAATSSSTHFPISTTSALPPCSVHDGGPCEHSHQFDFSHYWQCYVWWTTLRESGIWEYDSMSSVNIKDYEYHCLGHLRDPPWISNARKDKMTEAIETLDEERSTGFPENPSEPPDVTDCDQGRRLRLQCYSWWIILAHAQGLTFFDITLEGVENFEQACFDQTFDNVNRTLDIMFRLAMTLLDHGIFSTFSGFPSSETAGFSHPGCGCFPDHIHDLPPPFILREMLRCYAWWVHLYRTGIWAYYELSSPFLLRFEISCTALLLDIPYLEDYERIELEATKSRFEAERDNNIITNTMAADVESSLFCSSFALSSSISPDAPTPEIIEDNKKCYVWWNFVYENILQIESPQTNMTSWEKWCYTFIIDGSFPVEDHHHHIHD